LRHQQEDAGSTGPIELAAYITALRLAIDHFGLDAFSSAVAELAHRAMGIAPDAARVLADPEQTLTARESAFAAVSLALTGGSARSGTDG